MRSAVAIVLLLILGSAAFFFVRHHGKSNIAQRAPASPVASPSVKTNFEPPPPTNGFYIGKGDERVFVNYASSDPVLQSFLHSVVNDNADPDAQGREIFMRICAACHQKDGDGKDGVAPPLLGSEWVLSPTGSRMTHVVLNGLNGPIHVRNRDWNLSMPPWRENLNDDQIAIVLTFIRTQLGTNHAAAITAESVAAIRKEPDTKPETSARLFQITEKPPEE